MTTEMSNTSEALRDMIAAYRRCSTAGIRKAIMATAKLPLTPGESRKAIMNEHIHLFVDERLDGSFYVECSRGGEELLGLSGTARDERDALRRFAALVIATL